MTCVTYFMAKDSIQLFLPIPIPNIVILKRQDFANHTFVSVCTEDIVTGNANVSS